MKNLIFLFLITAALLYYNTLKNHRSNSFNPLQWSASYFLTLLSRHSSSSSWGSDGNAMRYEGGYSVETLVHGDDAWIVPFAIRVSDYDGELYAVDEANSNILKITPPLSPYSRARLVAGSFQGLLGHVDGKPSDARFNHPRGVASDDRGNVYVADTLNLAIRKIGDSGVTTIAGGKSSMAGYRDGPGEDAKFSSDFDVVYVRPTCSLLVVDRGNAALRQISLDQEDCNYQNISVSSADLLLVVGAVLVGYAACILRLGRGSPFFSRRTPFLVKVDGQVQPQRPASETVSKREQRDEKITPIVDNSKEFPGWPSFGQLMVDLSKLALEALAGIFFYLVPSRIRSLRSRKGLAPLKDNLRMPEDQADRKPAQRQRTPAPLSETTRHAHPQLEKQSEAKPLKIKSGSFKVPPAATKQKPSKRQEFADFCGTAEVPPYVKSKSHKERVRNHRHREKSGETGYDNEGTEQKQVDYQKSENYSLRNKHSSNESFRF
ncbi:hypothetical protein MLD38_002285 [Melastoma candidum]|uniref:Uncharacterized protein n=1 Tax=Melastoma candidum TaxID=119954 RepID=A0ACB9SHK0_9MYRT|nr:hypothetical protein MLD38_002285 [Melastoma candidum]